MYCHCLQWWIQNIVPSRTECITLGTHVTMWHKKRAKILSSHKHIWPPDDWPRDKEDDKKKVKPKRLTYIDDIYKWCHSYYDPKEHMN